MSRRKFDVQRKKRKLRCPVCHEPAGCAADVQFYGRVGQIPSRPEPGEVTECDHCRTLLEYIGDLVPIALKPASPERVRLFNKLSRNTPRITTLPEVIAYVKKYRQMPPHRNAGDNWIPRTSEELLTALAAFNGTTPICQRSCSLGWRSATLGRKKFPAKRLPFRLLI